MVTQDSVLEIINHFGVDVDTLELLLEHSDPSEDYQNMSEEDKRAYLESLVCLYDAGEEEFPTPREWLES